MAQVVGLGYRSQRQELIAILPLQLTRKLRLLEPVDAPALERDRRPQRLEIARAVARPATALGELADATRRELKPLARAERRLLAEKPEGHAPTHSRILEDRHVVPLDHAQVEEDAVRHATPKRGGCGCGGKPVPPPRRGERAPRQPHRGLPRQWRIGPHPAKLPR